MLALEEAFISICIISRAIIFVSMAKLSDRCFCYFTAAIFVPLRRTQTWRLHAKLYKFGWHTPANNTRMKNSKDLIFGDVVNISIIYRIPDSWLYSIERLQFLVLITWLVKTENTVYTRPVAYIVPKFEQKYFIHHKPYGKVSKQRIFRTKTN